MEQQLRAELERQTKKANGATDREIDMEEMKKEVVKMYKDEADRYVQQEIAKFQQQKLAEMEVEFQARLKAQRFGEQIVEVTTQEERNSPEQKMDIDTSM